MSESPDHTKTLYGHPPGLFVLFFAEMWERFSYYGMRALLVYYMVKGFLGYADHEAYAVYGSYTALIYLTPFVGGMLADRLLGQRLAVIFGGLLMATGHLLMTVEETSIFYLALAFIIAGNGFFKPNISTMVGQLYPPGDRRRDAGFVIFYMGINLGSASAPLLCGYLFETYGAHYGFGVATIGMLVGLSIFWAPERISRILILTVAVLTAASLVYSQITQPLVQLSLYALNATILVAAAVVAFRATLIAGLPSQLGRPPSLERLRQTWFGVPLPAVIVLSVLASVPLIATLITSSRNTRLLSDEWLKSLATQGPLGEVSSTLLGEMSTPAGLLLALGGTAAVTYLLREAFQMEKVPRERMYVMLTLTFGSMLFWSFFEQAGSSMANFTDRNVDRVNVTRAVGADDVGSTIEFRTNLGDTNASSLPPITQAQLGFASGTDEVRQKAADALLQLRAPQGSATPHLTEKEWNELSSLAQQVRSSEILTMTGLSALREYANAHPDDPELAIVRWVVTPENVGMGIGSGEIAASAFQAANGTYILLLGIPFTMLWGALAVYGWEPSTPTKFALGLLQVGLGFVALWAGAELCDERGMVGVGWLLLGYLLHTTGELCVSPVGLSMVTKLTPTRLVGTAMGMWFLATACAQFLAAIIAQFTGVGHGGDEGVSIIPSPLETITTYGSVFGKIAIAAIASSLIYFALVPLLNRLSHNEH